VCDNCGGFDTLSWREPTEATGPSATGTELLPLIVGPPPRPEPVPEPVPADDARPEIIDLEAIARAAN